MMSPSRSIKKLKFNESKLIQFALTTQPIYPRYFGIEVSHEGVASCVPSVGGITYNVQVGDPAFGWVADHIEPGISLGFLSSSSAKQVKALNHFASVGNTVTVLSGKAKGTKGVVIGHHGGVEHVIVDIPKPALKKVTYDDKFLIESWGMGLKVEQFQDIFFHNLDPRLATKLFSLNAQGKIKISVSTCVGAELMGSGLGTTDSTSGDFDIQTSDPSAVKKYNLNKLRLGDIVCLENFSHQFGWSYRKGFCTFGVIVHGDSTLSGHGPGVTTICSGPKKHFECNKSNHANVGNYLKCGTWRSP